VTEAVTSFFFRTLQDELKNINVQVRAGLIAYNVNSTAESSTLWEIYKVRTLVVKSLWPRDKSTSRYNFGTYYRVSHYLWVSKDRLVLWNHGT
jgi:hypothetical protein